MGDDPRVHSCTGRWGLSENESAVRLALVCETRGLVRSKTKPCGERVQFLWKLRGATLRAIVASCYKVYNTAKGSLW